MGICPGNICPYQQYLSCYWPDFDQTLNEGSWEHIKQITTVIMTFVHATFFLGTFVYISNISAFQAEHFRLQSCYLKRQNFKLKEKISFYRIKFSAKGKHFLLSSKD